MVFTYYSLSVDTLTEWFDTKQVVSCNQSPKFVVGGFTFDIVRFCRRPIRQVVQRQLSQSFLILRKMRCYMILNSIYLSGSESRERTAVLRRPGGTKCQCYPYIFGVGFYSQLPSSVSPYWEHVVEVEAEAVHRPLRTVLSLRFQALALRQIPSARDKVPC